jgi:hypothetical protein
MPGMPAIPGIPPRLYIPMEPGSPGIAPPGIPEREPGIPGMPILPEEKSPYALSPKYEEYPCPSSKSIIKLSNERLEKKGNVLLIRLGFFQTIFILYL